MKKKDELSKKLLELEKHLVVVRRLAVLDTAALDPTVTRGGYVRGRCSVEEEGLASFGKKRFDRRRFHLALQQEHHVRQATTHSIEKVVTSGRIGRYFVRFRRADSNPMLSN